MWVGFESEAQDGWDTGEQEEPGGGGGAAAAEHRWMFAKSTQLVVRA